MRWKFWQRRPFSPACPRCGRRDSFVPTYARLGVADKPVRICYRCGCLWNTATNEPISMPVNQSDD